MKLTRRAVLLILPCVIGLQGVLATTAKSSGYEVVFEKSYRSKDATYARVHSLVKTRDGGYAFSGQGYASWAWVVKTDAAGVKEWEAHISGSRWSDQDAFVVMDAPEGGLLIGGKTNSHDMVPGNWGDDGTPRFPYQYRKTPTVAFAARFDRRGRLLWRKAYGKMRDRRDVAEFYCGTSLSDGFLMIGRRSATVGDSPPRYIIALWIVKLSLNGEVAWERSVTEDGGDLVNPNYHYGHYCTTPIVGAGDEITFAVGMEKTPDGPYVNPPRFVLVMSFDRAGNELARARIDGGIFPEIGKTQDGLALLDQLLLREQRLQRTFFDRTLHVTGRSDVKLDGYAFAVKAAVASTRGDFHLAGNYVLPPYERGRAAIGYLPRSGGLEDLRKFGLPFFDWGDITAAAPGATPDEVVLLRQGGRHDDVGIVKLKLND